LGFQLKDDLLDVYANTNKFGKQVGGDIISNKKTFLLIKAQQLAQGELKEKLNYWLNLNEFNPEEKVNAVIGIYNRLGIKEISEQKMNTYFDRGLKILDELDTEDQKKVQLKELVLKLIDREK
jgi:geranylgeranyl diphosphate synthase type II